MNDSWLPPFPALRAFHAAARLGRFKLAAAELGVTESAVSHQIRRLEDFVHVQLFDRNGPRIGLTPAGTRYFEGIDPAIRAISEATRALAGPVERARVALTVPSSLASFWLIPKLGDFEAACPGVDLQLVTTTRVVDLRREQIDLAVRYGRGPWPGVDAEFLLAEASMPVCKPGFLQEGVGCKEGEEAGVSAVLSAHRLIVNEYFPDEWAEWSRARGIEPPDMAGALRLESQEQVLAAAEGGLGLGIGRSPVVDDRLQVGALIAPFGQSSPSSAGFYLCQASGGTLTAAAWRVAQWLRTFAQARAETE